MTAADIFDAHRGRLFALAYRMLGSRVEAEDLLQEAYIRWHQADRAVIENPEAWLVTTTTRLAVDRLRRLKTERDAYIGPWLPEPIVSAGLPDRDISLADALLGLAERPRVLRVSGWRARDMRDVCGRARTPGNETDWGWFAEDASWDARRTSGHGGRSRATLRTGSL